jgi:hypothetical protein
LSDSCQYLAEELGQPGTDMSLSAICLCDDDNDIAMALACSHAYIPALSSKSMEETIQQYPNKFTKTFEPGLEPTSATESALQLIYERVTKTQN